MDRWLRDSSGLSRPLFTCEQRLSADGGDCFEQALTSESIGDSARMLCLLDPCHLAKHPSWLLRNVLAFYACTRADTTSLTVPPLSSHDCPAEVCFGMHRLSAVVKEIQKLLQHTLPFSKSLSASKRFMTCNLSLAGKLVNQTKLHPGKHSRLWQLLEHFFLQESQPS